MIEYNEDKKQCKITFDKNSMHTLFNVESIYFQNSALLINKSEVNSIGNLHLHDGYLDFGSYSLPLNDIASVEFPTGPNIEKVTINLK